MLTNLSDCGHHLGERFRSLALIGLGLVLALGFQANAQPVFRFGHMTWAPKPSMSANSVEFTVTCGFQRDMYPGTAGDGHPAVNDIVIENKANSTITFGDGATSPVLQFRVLSIDVANNSFLGQALEPGNPAKMTVDHTYPSPNNFGFPWTAEIDGCCRVLPNHLNNPNKQFRIFTLVETATGNRPPTVSLTPLVQLQRGIASTFSISAVDTDPNTKLIWRLAKNDEASLDGSFVQPGPPFAPVPLRIDSLTGVATWNTAGLPIGTLWSCQVIVEDHDSTQMTFPSKSVFKPSIVFSGPKTVVVEDFLIMIVPGCAAPTFDPPTPICGSTVAGTVGTPVTFTVRASVPDPADVVTLTATGVPAGGTFVPPLPASGNVVTSTFTWLPTTAGMSVIELSAKDMCGIESKCSLTLNISGSCAGNIPPAPVPPTPICGSVLNAQVGVPFTFTISIADPDAGDRVTLNTVGPLPPGALMTPPLPITGNPAMSTFTWTPLLPGPVPVAFTATDTCGHALTCTYTIIVIPAGNQCTGNKPPAFVPPSPACGSTLTATVGKVFTLPVSVVDPDAGDRVRLDVAALPSGATMSPALPATGNPVNSTLTWTPSASGTTTIAFTAMDTCGNTASCAYAVQVVEPIGDGLLGMYFIEDPILVLTRIDPQINFDFGYGSPDPTIPQIDMFSMEWTGFVRPRFSEVYSFHTLADDGVRLWVDGQSLIDRWSDTPTIEDSGSIALTAGKMYSIKLDYYENFGKAVIKLFWQSPSQVKEIIPQERLFSSLSPQPIELASMRTKVVAPGKIAVAWGTVTEKTGSGFEVQRSADTPNNFTTVQVVEGHGATKVPQQYKYTDDVAGTNIWYYRIKQADKDGTVRYTDTVKVDVAAGLKAIAAPHEYTLSQNYPNPFNPETSIRFSVKDNVRATLRVYDMVGQEVATLFDDVAQAGQYYTIRFNAANLASGMYFYRLVAGESTQIRKMIVIK